MTWLAPLGFLGLISLIILIIIYIIKPNFQQKFVSSTYVWIKSLKYKKKKLPLNKLRNILLFLCQVAILTGAAAILAQPFMVYSGNVSEGDVILIIDASASMKTELNGQSRLKRAADAALAKAKEVMENGGKVSVILASEEAAYLVQQASKSQAADVYEAFDDLTKDEQGMSTYGTPDLDGAMKLAEQITAYSKEATVNLYTDTTYLNPGNVNVYKVNEAAEWNAAILDVRTTMVENYYRIEVDVASYGADVRMDLVCEIYDANDLGTTMEFQQEVYCSGDRVTTLVFGYVAEDMPESEKELIDKNLAVFSYEHIYIHLSEMDGLDWDNRYYLYGGKKPTLKVQYYSTMPNNFWTSALLVLQDIVKDRWTVEIHEVDKEAEPATEGFDLYIFEHFSPNMIPSDGVVIYSDPKNLPPEAGIRFGEVQSSQEEIFFAAGEAHPLMNMVNPSNISVTQFHPVVSADEYIPLAFIDQYPLILLKEDVDMRVLMMPFNIHYSNLSMIPAFPLLLGNVIDHYFPETVEKTVYEIGDTVKLNARADVLNVIGPNMELALQSFPAEITVTEPGTHTLSQVPLSGITVVESIFVKLSAAESNINLVESNLTNPYFYEDSDEVKVDLLFYFALAIVILLFLEWWLKSRDRI